MKKISLLVVFSMMCSVLMAEPIILQVDSKPVEVNGKSAAFNTIIQPNGTWGYIGHQGDNFDAIVKNNLNESTVIHWHGIILPNSQDGVNGITQDLPIAAHTHKLNISFHSWQLVLTGCIRIMDYKSRLVSKLH